MSKICTPSGRVVDFHQFTTACIAIEDIAQSLAYTNRYNGYLGTYSVAQHSIEVANRLPPELAFYGLMHDAVETYVGDMLGPLKNTHNCAGFRHIEDTCARVVELHFGIRMTADIYREVDIVDKDVVVDEVFSFATAAQKAAHCKTKGVDPNKHYRQLARVEPEAAKAAFISYFLILKAAHDAR